MTEERAEELARQVCMLIHYYGLCLRGIIYVGPDQYRQTYIAAYLEEGTLRMEPMKERIQIRYGRVSDFLSSSAYCAKMGTGITLYDRNAQDSHGIGGVQNGDE